MKVRICFLTLLVGSSWFATCVTADERKVITSIALEQEYTDNVFYSSESSVDDFISTISPGVELKNNTERMRAGAKMLLHGLYYYDNSELNTVDQDYSGTLRYGVSSRANLFTSAGYKRDSRIDSDFTETGLLQGNNVTRDRYTFRLGGDYALSEITGMQLQYGFDSDQYESSEYSDDTSHNVSLSLNRDLSTLMPATIGRINLGVSSFDFETSEVFSYTGTIGAERSLDERFSFFADIGVSYIESTFDSFRLVPTEYRNIFLRVPYEGNEDTCRMTGQAGMTYKGELTNAKVFFSRNVTSASGENGVVERTGLYGSIGRKLNETSRVMFSAGYVENSGSEDTEGVASIDTRSYWLRPKLSYSLTDQIVAETSYSYSFVDDLAKDTDKYRNLVMVRLIFSYAVLE